MRNQGSGRTNWCASSHPDPIGRLSTMPPWCSNQAPLFQSCPTLSEEGGGEGRRRDREEKKDGGKRGRRERGRQRKRSRHPHSFQKVTQLQIVITSNNSLWKEGRLSGWHRSRKEIQFHGNCQWGWTQSWDSPVALPAPRGWAAGHSGAVRTL